MKPHLLLSLLLALPLGAQDPAAPPPAPAPTQVSKPAPVVVTLSFAGGSLGEFVAAVRKQEPRANIIIDEGALLAKLPPIELRGAGLEQALEAACTVAQGDGKIGIKHFGGAGEPVYTITSSRPRTLPTASGADAPTTHGVPKFSQVYGLSRLIDPQCGGDLRVAAVLSAIETATSDDGTMPTLRFHEESKLLVVRASAEQLQLINLVLEHLGTDVDRRRVEAERRGATPVGRPTDAKPVQPK